MYTQEALRKFTKETGYPVSYEIFEKAFFLEQKDTEEFLRRHGRKRLRASEIEEAALSRLIMYAKERSYPMTTATVKALTGYRLSFLLINMAVSEIAG